MPLRLDSQSADFPQRFRDLLATKREAAEDVEKLVRGIVSDVAARGDKALFELTAKFDRIDLAKDGLARDRRRNRGSGKGVSGGNVGGPQGRP